MPHLKWSERRPPMLVFEHYSLLQKGVPYPLPAVNAESPPPAESAPAVQQPPAPEQAAAPAPQEAAPVAEAAAPAEKPE